MMTAREILETGKQKTEAKMLLLLADKGKNYSAVTDAMRYSAMLGGKRLRPSLLLEFYRLCGGRNDVSDFAAAIEFVHTYSLIHDDLPCMDNDDMRRGKASCHVRFGEDTALLAGDGLLTLAFVTMLGSNSVPPQIAVKAAACLAENAGTDGMIGGQVIDLLNEKRNPSLESIKEMYALKTGALINSSAKMGCILAEAEKEEMTAALVYTENIGLAFQIVDDILDVTGTSEELGKPVGSDKKNDKHTYVSKVGIEKARDEVIRLTDAAVAALTVFGNDADGLRELAELLTTRKN